MKKYTHYCLNTGQAASFNSGAYCAGCGLSDFVEKCVIPSMIIGDEDTTLYKAAPNCDYEVNGRVVPGGFMIMALWLGKHCLASWSAVEKNPDTASALWEQQMEWAEKAWPALRPGMMGGAALGVIPKKTPKPPWAASSFHPAVSQNWEQMPTIRGIEAHYIDAFMAGVGKLS